jgi:hypothetical protein
MTWAFRANARRNQVGRGILIVWVAAGLAGGCRQPSQQAAGQQSHSPSLVSPEIRAAALRTAQVWQPPAIPIPKATLRANPVGPGRLDDGETIECRLIVKPMGGTTPKFDCERPNKDVIRVKYGYANPEIFAEVAATRLLAALGFGADRMYVVKRVRCAGCTAFPFHSLRCLADTGIERGCFPGGVDYENAADFDSATVERRIEGRRLESKPDEGWAWYELSNVNAAAGGAPRAHVDALKLIAIVLAHWDNKAENQRLLCLPGGDLPGGGCSRPFAIIQDVGATFGPLKMDLHNWRSLAVWKDPRTCQVTMEHLPWGGGTFEAQTISEEGRRFLLSLIEQLTDTQLQDLFAGARIDRSEGVMAESRRPDAWAAAFADKVKQIREAGPCPNSR